MRFFFKKIIASFWGAVFKRATSPDALDLRVLCYHSVNNIYNDECDPITPELFEKHIEFISNNYHPVTAQDVIDFYSEKTPLPDNAVLVTFDDGYKDNYEQAYPILKKYNCPAVIFLVSRFVDSECKLINDEGWDAMSWEQVRLMSEEGLVEFGGHTLTHHTLSSLDENEAVYEVMNSIKDIEKNISQKVRVFAYPNGQASDIPSEVVNAVSKSNLQLSFSTLWKSWSNPRDRYLLNRIMTTGSDSIETLKAKLDGEYDYLYWVHLVKGILIKISTSKGIGLPFLYRNKF